MKTTSRNTVSDLLRRTHAQVGLAPEEKKIRFAIDNAGFTGWMAATFNQLKPDHFRAIIDGKNLIIEQSKKKE